LLVAGAIGYSAYNAGFIKSRFRNARSLLVLIIVFSIIYAGIPNTAVGIDAFAKKIRRNLLLVKIAMIEILVLVIEIKAATQVPITICRS
jgi:hypothetical protein